MIESDYILKNAYEVGFSLCGIVRARPIEEYREQLEEWFECGYDSDLEYIKRGLDKRLDPVKLVEGAQTIVVCAANYKNAGWDQSNNPNQTKIASYAYARDYHLTIKEMLAELLRRIKERYAHATGRCFSDTAPILEKVWAIEAGLGWRGKNSLLITPKYGSYVLLGEIVLCNEVSDYSAPFEGERCGSCKLCIETCPTSAIKKEYVVDTNRCISRITVETPRIEAPFVPLNGWIFGCDECQSCCPHNQSTPLYTLPLFAPVMEHSRSDSKFWESLSESKFSEIFGSTPLVRTGYTAIRKRAVSEAQEN